MSRAILRVPRTQKAIRQVHHLFGEIPHKDIFALNALLATLVRRDELGRSWSLFVQIHQMRHDLDAYTFTPVLKACSAVYDLQRGKQVHGLVIKTGSNYEIVTQTALIDMYSKSNRLSECVRIFEKMKDKDVVVRNAMISCYLRHGLSKNALGIFYEMRRDRVAFSEVTLSSLLKVCASLKAFQQGKQVHALVVVMGRDLLVLSTNLVDFYSSCALMEEAMKVLDCLNCRKDDAIYNALVSGCIQNQKYVEAISILSKMKPNVVSLTSGFVACSECSDMSTGKKMHSIAIRLGFDSDTQLSNSLMSTYAKCGKITTAQLLFDRITDKNVVSWTCIIDAYGSQGNGRKALELFKEMEESGVSPNSATFLTVLSACGHSGLVKEGRECFISMKEKHRVEPGPEHYACYIDLLGRSGLIEEVWDLFHSMGEVNCVKTGAVLAALLNACRINLDVQRGAYAAKLLVESGMEKPGTYVALSNFFAAIGRWDRVEHLRSMMCDQGLHKVAGSSWLTSK